MKPEALDFGMPVQTSHLVPRFETERVQFRTPRSKRRRIRRKWAKRARNWRVQIKRPAQAVIYNVAGTLWMHPATWEDLKRALP